MKALPHLMHLAALACCLAPGLAAAHAALPSLQPLQQRRWPAEPGGAALGVKVMGNYACVTDNSVGLQVIDVSNPTNCVRVGGYNTSASAWGVAVVTDRI